MKVRHSSLCIKIYLYATFCSSVVKIVV